MPANAALILSDPDPSTVDWSLYSNAADFGTTSLIESAGTLVADFGDSSGAAGVGVGVFRSVTPTALGIGETAILSFDVIMNSNRTGAAGNARQFRFSLGDSNGSGNNPLGLNTNNQFDRIHSFAVAATGIGGNAGGGFFNSTEAGVSATYESGVSGGDGGSGGNAAGVNIPDGVSVTVTFEYTRTAAAAAEGTLTLSGGSTGSISVSGFNADLDTIDRIVIGGVGNFHNTTADDGFTLDNVSLQIIPEPASLALVTGGSMLMLSRRRN